MFTDWFCSSPTDVNTQLRTLRASSNRHTPVFQVTSLWSLICVFVITRILYRAILSCKNMLFRSFCFFEHPRYCASKNRRPGSERQSRILLQRFEALGEGRSAKAIGSLMREELDSFTTTMHRHQALFTRESLAKINIASLPYAFCSLDLAPEDFYFSRKCSPNIADIQSE